MPKRKARNLPQTWPRAQRMVRVIITVTECLDGDKLDEPSRHVFTLSMAQAKALRTQLDTALE